MACADRTGTQLCWFTQTGNTWTPTILNIPTIQQNPGEFNRTKFESNSHKRSYERKGVLIYLTRRRVRLGVSENRDPLRLPTNVLGIARAGPHFRFHPDAGALAYILTLGIADGFRRRRVSGPGTKPRRTPCRNMRSMAGRRELQGMRE